MRHDATQAPHAIIEELDATSEQKINEVFTGVLSGDVDDVKTWIQSLDNNNQQEEYY